VGGPYQLTAGGAITVNTGGVTTANGPIQLVGSSIRNNDTITNGGGASTTNILLRADTFNLNGNPGTSQVQAGGGAVILTPNTNSNTLAIVSPGGVGTTTVAQADLDTIQTTNFVVLGSANQGFTGNTIIGDTAVVNGNGKNLAFFRADTAPITATTTIGSHGVSTTG